MKARVMTFEAHCAASDREFLELKRRREKNRILFLNVIYLYSQKKKVEKNPTANKSGFKKEDQAFLRACRNMWSLALSAGLLHRHRRKILQESNFVPSG